MFCAEGWGRLLQEVSRARGKTRMNKWLFACEAEADFSHVSRSAGVAMKADLVRELGEQKPWPLSRVGAG